MSDDPYGKYDAVYDHGGFAGTKGIFVVCALMAFAIVAFAYVILSMGA